MQKFNRLLVLAALCCGLFVSVGHSQRREFLLNGSVAIPAGNVWYQGFAINRDGRVSGRFRADGGGKDIYCVIVDSDGYENLKNGNQFLSYYNLGKVTVAN